MAWTKIKDGLFVGDRDSVEDYDLLQPNSITYFVNTAASELDFVWQGVEFLTFHWVDDPGFTCFDDHGIVIDQLVSFIDEGVRLGQSVLVYSNRGLSRAIGACCAYMIAKYGWGCDKTLEFFESKRVPMDMNPGLARQLYDLDWRLQRRRLKQILAAPLSEQARTRLLEVNRVKLLTWHTGTSFLVDPAQTEDLSSDELILVNSFVNGRSAFLHSNQGLPPPARGTAEGHCHTATALRWIDEDEPAVRSNRNGHGGGDGGGEDAKWVYLRDSKPILDVNEAVIWIEEEPPPETTRSL